MVYFQVECLELSADGTLLATGGRDNKIVLSTINIDEAELHKFTNSQKCVGGREGSFHRPSRGKMLTVDELYLVIC